MPKQPFTVYHTIRIDGEFDTSRHEDATEAVSCAIRQVISDALSHSHTIEEGITISDITDCGETV